MTLERVARLLLLVFPSTWFSACPALAQQRERIDLNGRWEFRRHPQSLGGVAGWSSSRQPFPDSIVVPGAWRTQGFGKRAGVICNDYSGQAWYRRHITVPASWRGRVIHLRVGGVLRRATVFINGISAGSHDGFSTPFALNVTRLIRPGASNTIVFLVSNPANPIEDSPDKQKAADTGMLNYIGNWGGIYGNVELEAASPSRIDEVAIVPDIQKSQARFTISLRSDETGTPYPATVEVEAGGFQVSSGDTPPRRRHGRNPHPRHAGGSALVAGIATPLHRHHPPAGIRRWP